MARAKMPRPKVRSRMAAVRLRDEEWAALQQFAAALRQTPSRIMRRLIREAITGGPDYFTDELVDVRGVRRELAKIGNNLNQLAKAANRGHAVPPEDLRRTLNVVAVEVAAAKALYHRAVVASTGRAVVAGATREVLAQGGEIKREAGSE